MAGTWDVAVFLWTLQPSEHDGKFACIQAEMVLRTGLQDRGILDTRVHSTVIISLHNDQHTNEP